MGLALNDTLVAHDGQLQDINFRYSDDLNMSQNVLGTGLHLMNTHWYEPFSTLQNGRSSPHNRLMRYTSDHMRRVKDK
jgi:hypothetical protein